MSHQPNQHYTAQAKLGQARPLRGVGVVMVAFVLGGAAAFGVLHITRPHNPLPDTLRRQIHFAVVVPGSDVPIDASSYKYDSALGVLSFTARLYGQTATFAEQATPDAFTDIPNFYDKFLAKLSDYTAFESQVGTVHLTHPKDAGQAAVVSTKGTLVFVRVARDEPKSTWQQLFAHSSIYEP